MRHVFAFSIFVTVPLSAAVLHVDQSKAGATADGSEAAPFRTISEAAKIAKAGDNVSVEPGIYRENVAPANGGTAEQPVTYQAAHAGTVFVKGSDVFQAEWSEENGIFSAPIPPAMYEAFHRSISIGGSDKSIDARPAPDKELLPVLGQIFINDKPFTQVTETETLQSQIASWMIDASGEKLSVHFPNGSQPADFLIEVTTRSRIFAPARRGLSYVHVSGFVFEHCANQGPFPQRGAVGFRSGKNWLFENNVIRYASTIGLDCGSETWDGANLPDTDDDQKKLMIGGNHRILNNEISDNGLSGIAGWNQKGSVIRGNLLERNNRLGFSSANASWEEWAAIKLHESDALIEGNLIRDNYAHGIWIDNGFDKARVTRNVILNNKGAGIFFEYGNGNSLIDSNIIGNTTAKDDFYDGCGIYTHDSSGVNILNNLIFNCAGPAIRMRTITNRKRGSELVETSRERIVNNLLVGNGRAIELPYPGPRAKDNFSDGNVISDCGRQPFAYIYTLESLSGEKLVKELTAKSPAIGEIYQLTGGLDLEGWRSISGWDKNSRTDAVKIGALSAEPTLRLTIPENFTATSLDCQLDSDFFGKPFKAQPPGPFAALAAGKYHFVLWPVAAKTNYRTPAPFVIPQ